MRSPRCGPRRSTSQPRTPTSSRRSGSGASGEARLAALREAREKKREKTRARNAVIRAKALEKATAAERAARQGGTGRLREVAIRFRTGIDQALVKLANDHSVTATVGFSTGDPRYAGGVPLVDEDGVPAAVFDPDPGRVRGEAILLLAGLLLIFPSKTNLRGFNNSAYIKKKHGPIDGYRTDVVETTPADGSARGWARCSSGGPCTCAVPRLVAKIANAEYPAEPSEQMSPAAALFRVECRACSRRYDGPWCQTGSSPLVNQTTSLGLIRFDGHSRSGVQPREDVHHGEHGEEETSP
ncbi:hypothetical protein ACFVYB_25415, partial [Streptomyces sp. NPDC058228]